MRLPDLTTGWTGKLSLHLVGLDGQCTCPLGFVIVRLQVMEVAGYDEDVVFLVVPDDSAFDKRVPLVMGTCTLA